MDGPAAARGELIDGSRSALRAGDAAGARSLLDDARTTSEDDPDILECYAKADYLDLDFAAAAEHWQRAYAQYRILTKLGLRSRAEAAAYATRLKPARE